MLKSFYLCAYFLTFYFAIIIDWHEVAKIVEGGPVSYSLPVVTSDVTIVQQFNFNETFLEKFQDTSRFHTWAHARTWTHTEQLFHLRVSAWRQLQSIAAYSPEGKEAGKPLMVTAVLLENQVKPRRLETNGRIIWSHNQDPCVKASTISDQTKQPDRLEEHLYDTQICIHYSFSFSQRKRHNTKHSRS